MPIDYHLAHEILLEEFSNAEDDFRAKIQLSVSQNIQDATERLFASSTQAYREAVIGCALARVVDQNIDIRLPYMKQAESAFNGRTLDERVVNPFLRDRRVPCSKGPYLSALRRNVRFVPETAVGLRDKKAYGLF